MRAHFATGNRAEALRAYEHFRKLLVEELGIDPSDSTNAVYLDILRAPWFTRSARPADGF